MSFPWCLIKVYTWNPCRTVHPMLRSLYLLREHLQRWLPPHHLVRTKSSFATFHKSLLKTTTYLCLCTLKLEPPSHANCSLIFEPTLPHLDSHGVVWHKNEYMALSLIKDNDHAHTNILLTEKDHELFGKVQCTDEVEFQSWAREDRDSYNETDLFNYVLFIYDLLICFLT